MKLFTPENPKELIKWFAIFNIPIALLFPIGVLLFYSLEASPNIAMIFCLGLYSIYALITWIISYYIVFKKLDKNEIIKFTRLLVSIILVMLCMFGIYNLLMNWSIPNVKPY